MSRVRVRRAVLADLPRLAALFDAYRQFQGRGPDVAAAAAFLRDRFDLGESIVFLAETGGGEAAGFTQLYPSFSSVALARTFILNDLFVASDHRRSGVATALLDAAVAHAGSLGAVRVSLNTAVGNTTAQALYEARGWSRDREFFAYHFVPRADAESAA